MKPFRLIVNGGNTYIQEYKKADMLTWEHTGCPYNN